MVEDVADPQKQKQVAAKTKSSWKDWALFILGALVVLLLYYQFVYSKNFTVQMNGTEMILFAGILCAFLFWYFKMHQEPVLPEKHVIARDVANWCYNHNGGTYIDYAGCEVTHISEKRAKVYFPAHARTYTVEATPEGQPVKVIEEGWKDLESSLFAMERSKVVEAYTKQVASREKIEKDLAGMGMVPE